jgi:hypothetical protein
MKPELQTAMLGDAGRGRKGIDSLLNLHTSPMPTPALVTRRTLAAFAVGIALLDARDGTAPDATDDAPVPLLRNDRPERWKMA